jgi:hypothetical protein
MGRKSQKDAVEREGEIGRKQKGSRGLCNLVFELEQSSNGGQHG